MKKINYDKYNLNIEAIGSKIMKNSKENKELIYIGFALITISSLLIGSGLYFLFKFLIQRLIYGS